MGAARAAGVAGPLADALYISARILRERDLEHEHLTALTAVWGQLVSHDIAYTLPISGDTSRLKKFHPKVRNHGEGPMLNGR